MLFKAEVAVRAMGQQVRDLRVLFISGGDEPNVKAHAAGAPYLLKPFTNLALAVRGILEQKARPTPGV